jgi:hypothetical protein
LPAVANGCSYERPTTAPVPAVVWGSYCIAITHCPEPYPGWRYVAVTPTVTRDCGGLRWLIAGNGIPIELCYSCCGVGVSAYAVAYLDDRR